MLTGSNLLDPVLINTVGHTAGVLLFGFIITLFLRDRRSHGICDTKRSILAAALALAWNVGSLIALGSKESDSLFLRIVMTASFAALSLLPAVLLQVTLQGQLTKVTYAGYVISAAAILLHVAELFVNGFTPHQLALLLVAGGFGTLSVIAFVANRRIRPSLPGKRTEWLSLTCLLLFVSSFPHFGYQHFRSPWTAEIAWHHIGIPVALIVLLQDYRFLLLDTFIRFLMNSGLAAAYVVCLLTLNKKFHFLQLISSSVFLSGIAIVALCLSLILFAHVRNLLQRWIGRAVFHRQNLDARIRAIAELSAKTQNEEALISSAAREVAAHLRVERFAVVGDFKSGEKPNRPAMLFGDSVDDRPAALVWAEAQTPLRFSSGEVRFLLTGPRRGRQRYLSEDLEDMRRLAAIIVERVERFRAEELKRLAAEAELRALQAQINPHFLFNAFNTLYGTIDRGSLEARRLVLNLTEIFRYFLQGDRVIIPLSEELRIIRAYLEIEALRLGDRLETELDVSEAALPVMIPILSVQPLVENAVKHGVANKTGRGLVVVRAHSEDGMLRITIEDRSKGLASSSPSPNGTGVGLANVRRRMQLSYGSKSSLEVSYGIHGSTATLLIPTMMNPPERARQVEAVG